MVGFKFLVHNGKVYNDVYVTEDGGEKTGRVFTVSFPDRVLFLGRGNVCWPGLGCHNGLLIDGGVCRTRKRFTYKLSKNK